MDDDLKFNLADYRRERWRFISGVVGGLNFLAFIAHVLNDGTCAAFCPARLVNGHYLVMNHGKENVFTPAAYWFSFWHDIIFVLVHLACMFALWALKKREPSAI